MRVLQVNKFLYPKGGAEIVCLGLAEQLGAAGHEVRLFGMQDPRNPTGPDDDCFPPAVDYHARRSAARKATEALRTIYGLRARRGMARLLDRWRPDLIHAHNIYHQLTPAILAPARARKVPVLLTLHDYKLACPVYTFLRDGGVCEECLGRLPLPLLRHRCKGGSLAESAVLFSEALLHRALRSYERGVTLFTAPSRFLRGKLVATGLDPGRIVHLANALPLDAATLARAYAPPPAREAPELLWVGRLSYEKGLATLLTAVSRARRPLRLALVGDGPEEGPLRRLAGELALGDRVRFLGRRPRDEIPALLAAADATVLPSEWYENAPLSVLESLALGRPVLASRLGGTPELVAEGETGWLFDAGDADALAACLDDWAGAPQERRRRGERAHAEARRRFHPDRILAETLTLYARLGARP
ncbi:MAG: glycosyltransferase [Candidatus Krumholzibacteriota bacterium]|nr:glycosyltransferase [Candidatus Krumholzibacteriota bacterium]